MARLRMFDLAEETLLDTTLRIDDAQDAEIAKAHVYDIAEMLEEEGIVGPPGEAGKPREILRR